MQINKGEKSNYIERFHGVELVLRNVTQPDTEKVITVPQKLLIPGEVLYDPSLPFKIKIHQFGVNCDFDIGKAGEPKSELTSDISRGIGKSVNLNIVPKDEDYSSDAINFGYLIFELIDGSKSLGKWASISHPAGNHLWGQLSPTVADMEFQSIRHQGDLWGIALRQEREYLPFSIELLDIENEFYQGTETPLTLRAISIFILRMSKQEEHLFI